MSLTGYPINTKYTPGDTVYAFSGGQIKTLTVNSWRVEVDNPSDDGIKGRQINYYKFDELGETELKESELFSSKNHIRSFIKGDFINRAIQTAGTGSDFVHYLYTKDDNVALTFGSWADFAGFNLSNANFINENDEDPPNNIDVILPLSEMILDNANLDMALLPASIDTLSEIKAAVKSYDNYSTKWTDGGQFLRSDATGTVDIADGSANITGTGTAFDTEIKEGDQILIPIQSGIIDVIIGTVLSTDSTHLTLSEELSVTASDLTMIILPAPPNG